MNRSERLPHFIVFRKSMGADVQGKASGNFPALVQQAELHGPWSVAFDTTWGGLVKAIFPELMSWTKRPREGIKYYSGKATYKKTVDVKFSGAGRLFLDLGAVRNVAVVRLNGQNLGILWCAPWRVDFSTVVKATGNVLEVDVIDLWANRVIGDLSLPKDKRVTHTHDAFRFDMLRASTPLLDEGLMGPVRVFKIRYDN